MVRVHPGPMKGAISDGTNRMRRMPEDNRSTGTHERALTGTTTIEDRVRKQEKPPGREPGEFVGSTPTSVTVILGTHLTTPFLPCR